MLRYVLILNLIGICISCSSPSVDSSASSAILLTEFVYEEAPFPSCHASTIEESTHGILMAAWFGGTHEKHPDVGIWFSRKEESGWTSPVEVANGIQSDTLRYPCWNPVLFQPQSGPMHLYYKVGPSPREWWGMLITSDDDGKSWGEPLRLPDNFIGPVKNKSIEPEAGLILAPSSSEHDGWVVHIERSEDNGESWEIIGPINEKGSLDVIQPSLLILKNGDIEMLCRTKQGYISHSISKDQGKTWGEMTLTALPNPNSGIDAVTLADGRHLLVYNPTKPPEGKWGGPRSPLSLAVSEDGTSWQDVATLEDEEGEEFSYPAIIQTQDGKVHITYTWKRERVKHVLVDPGKI